jgi:hypothetical protein
MQQITKTELVVNVSAHRCSPAPTEVIEWTVKISAAHESPVGTKWTWQARQTTSVIEGKADLPVEHPHFSV